MNTITYTDSTGTEYTTSIDHLIELVQDDDERVYCVFLSYYSNYDQKNKLFVISGSIKECLAYIWMYAVDAGYADIFEVGGPVWQIPDDCAIVRGSYDELRLVPLSVANKNEYLRSEMRRDPCILYANLCSIKDKCRIS